MPKSRQSITCGNFKAVRQVVRRTGIAGEWSVTQNHCQFRAANGAVLNYWKKHRNNNFPRSRVPSCRAPGNGSPTSLRYKATVTPMFPG
jgi:hypothetical protein